MLVVEEGTERVLVSETGEQCFEMMSSGHDRAIELTDSPQLQLSARDMHKLKPANMPVRTGKGRMKSHP